MPDQEQVQETEPIASDEEYVPGEQDGGTEEPYSAQLLRQLHDDAGRLLERYDSMLPPLEHEAIKKFVEGYCQFLDSQMTEIEDHFAEHHPDLEPLEGMEPVASEDEEAGEATPEEAAEASEPEGSETEPEKKPKEKSEEEEEPEGGEKSLTPEQVKELRGKHKGLPTPPVVGESALAGDEDGVEAIDHAEGEAGINFEPHEVNHLADAHGFLSTVVNQREPWGEIQRQESYHHHRNLRSIASKADGGHVPGMEHEEKRILSPAESRAATAATSAHRRSQIGQVLSSRAGARQAAPAGPRGGTHTNQTTGKVEHVSGKRTKPGYSPRLTGNETKVSAENEVHAGGRTSKLAQDVSTTAQGIPKKPTSEVAARKPVKPRGETNKYGAINKDMDVDDDKGMEVLQDTAQYKSAHHETVGKTAGFLQLLSTLKDGGLEDEHRQYAAEYANGLESAMGSADGEKATPRDGGEETAAQPEDETLDPHDVPGDEELHEKAVQMGNRGHRVLRKPANLRNDDTAITDNEAPEPLAQRRGRRESAMHKVPGGRPQAEFYSGSSHEKSLIDETNEQRASILEFNKKIVELAKKLG